jgi:protoporphyrinogen oxidase
VGRGRYPGVPRREARRLRRLARLTRRFRTLLDPSRPEAAVRLDDRSAADFVRVYFGRHLLERGVDPLLRAELGADAEQTSRVALWLQLLARDALTTGTFRAGLGLLARALHDPAHDRLGARARAVEARGDGLVLSVEGPAGAVTLEADAVLLATPARVALQVAAPLLRTPERDFLGAARSVPAVVLAAGLDRVPLRHSTALRFPRVEGWPLAGAVLEPGSAAARAPEGAALAMLVADDGWSRAHLEASEDGVSKALLEWLERLFPGAGSALRFARVRRYRHAWPRFDVGRYRALDRFARVQADLRAGGRRLYFAGDHLVAPTLEGAVVSGLRAARAIAADLALRAG